MLYTSMYNRFQQQQQQQPGSSLGECCFNKGCSDGFISHMPTALHTPSVS